MTKVPKQFYKISEVAEIIGENTSLLRYWETQFEQLQPLKTKGGARKYTLNDLELVKQIHMLTKEKGLTLAGVKEVLNKTTKIPSKNNKALVINKLQSIKSYLLALKSELED